MANDIAVAAITATAGIVGAVGGALVGGAIGWVGAYHTAIKSEERRERRDREQEKREAARRDERIRTAIGTQMSTFLDRWGPTLRVPALVGPVSLDDLERLEAHLTRFQAFPAQVTDISDQYRQGRYLQWHMDAARVTAALYRVDHPGDELAQDPIERAVALRLNAQARATIKSVLTIAEEFRLGVDVFDAGEGGLVTTPGVGPR